MFDTTKDGCIPIFTAETFHQWDFAFLFFTVKVVRNPINQHVKRGCEWRRVRPHGSHTDAVLLLSFFFLIRPPPFNYPFSSLFQLASTQGNEFSYEVKYELYRECILIHFCMASTMTFPKRMGWNKFLPDVCFATSLDVFLIFLSRRNRLIHIFFLNIHIRAGMDWVYLQRRSSKSRQRVETAINSRVGWFSSHVIIIFLVVDCTSQEKVWFCLKIDHVWQLLFRAWMNIMWFHCRDERRAKAKEINSGQKYIFFKTNNKSVKQTTDKNLRKASLSFPPSQKAYRAVRVLRKKRQWIMLNLSVLLDICSAISFCFVVLSPLMDLSSAQHEHHSNWSPVERSASTDGFSQRSGHTVMAVPAQCFMGAYCPFIYWNLISFSMSQLSYIQIFTRDAKGCFRGESRQGVH